MIDRYDAGMIFIGSVALLFVFIAGTFSRIQRRRAKARRQNAEVYNALQQGVVDGAENSVTWYISMKHIEAAKYFVNTQHLFGVDPIFASAKWFNAQPANIQKIFRDVMRESIANQRKIWVEAEMADYGRATKMGAIITDADIPAFQRKVKPIWEQNKTNLSGLYEIVEATQ